MGTFDVYPQTGKRIWSANARAFFGIPPDVEITDEDVWSKIHPDDVARVRREWQQAIGAHPTRNAESLWITAPRIRYGGSRERWLYILGRVLVDEQGQAERVIGVMLISPSASTWPGRWRKAATRPARSPRAC